ncbi:SKI-domain-containing protein [Atractiella rhizophila]|nr:SKI-domain-containing protein [Atractiella rhizophila]
MDAPTSPRSLILIGMRGVGKTTLGLIAATSLSRPFIDADALFSSKNKTTISAYVAENGWERFRDEETGILEGLLDKCGTGYVVACGGGVVERERNRELLKEFGRSGGTVIHVRRDEGEVVKYLVSEKTRPLWDEHIRSVWERRTPFFSACSTHTYFSLTALRSPQTPPSMVLKPLETSFLRFLHFILQSTPSSPHSQRLDFLSYASDSERRTYALQLCEEDPTTLRKEDTTGANVIEVRIDLVKSELLSSEEREKGRDFVARSISKIRSVTTLPIIFTVRTVLGGGSFPDFMKDATWKERYLDLLRLGVEIGCEFVDVELRLGADELERLARSRGTTHLIGTDIDLNQTTPWCIKNVQPSLDLAQQFDISILRLVRKAHRMEDNLDLERLRGSLNDVGMGMGMDGHKPVIAYNTERIGQLSRTFNTLLTPISASSIFDDDGDLTFSQIQESLFLAGLKVMRTVFLSGHSLEWRRELQEKADSLNLHIRFECSDVETIQTALSSSSFAGAVLNFFPPPASDASSSTSLCDVITRLPTSSSSTSHNVFASCLSKTITENLSPINAVTSRTVALITKCSGKAYSDALVAIEMAGIKKVFVYDCDPAFSSQHLLPTLRVPPPNLSASEARVELVDLNNTPPPTSTPTSVSIIISAEEGDVVPRTVGKNPNGGVVLRLGKRSSTLHGADGWIEIGMDRMEKTWNERVWTVLTGLGEG